MKEKIKKIFTKDFFKNIWTKIWGEDVPPAEELYPDDLYNNYLKYEEKIKKTKKRRVIIGSLLTILCITLLFNIISGIKNNSFLACLGKDVCITKGPKLNYPSVIRKTYSSSSGNIFVGSNCGNDGYNYFYHKLMYIPRNLLLPFYWSGHFNSKDRKNAKFFNKISKRPHYFTAELYIKKKNKFIKIKNTPDIIFEVFFNGVNNNIYILSNKGIKRFNTNTKQFSDGPKFANKEHKYTFIAQYDKNRVFGYEYITDKTTKYPTHKPIRPYLFDLTTGTKKQLPLFAIQTEVFPLKEDYKFLSNGKIIIPIRERYSDIKGTSISYYYKWNHIEIYDPEKNVFMAETNTDVLDKNLFDIELPNGNVVFINKESIYIFDNKNNKFVRADLTHNEKYTKTVAKIQDLSAKTMGIELNNHIDKTTKIIKIAPDKFLITCGDKYYEGAYKKSTANCNQTVYYDFTKNKVTKGPTFIYPHYYSSIEQIEPGKFLVVGGTPEFSISDDYSLKLPNLYTQIIKVKK